MTILNPFANCFNFAYPSYTWAPSLQWNGFPNIGFLNFSFSQNYTYPNFIFKKPFNNTYDVTLNMDTFKRTSTGYNNYSDFNTVNIKTPITPSWGNYNFYNDSYSNTPMYSFGNSGLNATYRYGNTKKSNTPKTTLTNNITQNAVQLAIEEKEKGVTENLGTNDGTEIRKYKNGAANSNAWCASFISWLYGKGQGKTAPFGYTASSQEIMRQAKSNDVFASKTSGYTPVAGDVAVWTKKGDPAHGHVAIVKEIKPNGDIVIIEGNYSNKVSERTMKTSEAEFSGFAKMSEWTALA